MRRLIAILALAGCLAAPQATPAADPEPGNYRLVYFPPAPTDIVMAVVKLDKKDGKWAAELVAASPQMSKLTLGELKADGKLIHIPVNIGQELMFEGVLGSDATLVRGSLGNDRLMFPAALMRTDDEKVTQPSVPRGGLPPAMQEVQKLNGEVNGLRRKQFTTKDDAEKKKIGEEVSAKQKEIDPQIGKLYRKVIAENADNPAALDAALALVRAGRKYQATPEELKQWAQSAVKTSEMFGPRFRAETMLNLAETLAANPATNAVAADIVRQTEKALGPDAPPAKQERVLTALAMALGDSADAKDAVMRLEAVTAKLDREQDTKAPKMDAKPFEGRKEGGTQVVLMELFTGAQCPPCVPADVAFDHLPQAYKPTELITLQYHMHIPGPDPLTNADSEARFNYYAKAFPDDIGGTPATLFNGAPKAGGGGRTIDEAVGKFKAYRDVVEPLLAEAAKAKVSVKASRSGDNVTISASVADVEKPSENVRLRFALVEESVRYPGGNGLRVHHHVVRALPGGADGMVISGKSESKQVTVNLADLRGQLTKYLDEYAETKNPFPRLNRPLDLKHLKVVAWVQDDSTHAVLQAAQADVGG